MAKIYNFDAAKHANDLGDAARVVLNNGTKGRTLDVSHANALIQHTARAIRAMGLNGVKPEALAQVFLRELTGETSQQNANTPVTAR